MSDASTVYSMSVRNPWAYLIAKGYKKIENRHKGLPDSKLKQPIALHVPKKQYPKKERHEYYAMPLVQQCLKTDKDTRHFYNDYEKLDAFFKEQSSAIIAILFIEQTVKSSDLNRASIKYKFANVPKTTSYHWILSDAIHYLPNPIPNFNGSLGVSRVDNAHVKRLILQSLDKKDTQPLQLHVDQKSTMQTSNVSCERLSVPRHVLEDPVRHLMHNGFRMIYDSDAECSDDEETQSENASPNKKIPIVSSSQANCAWRSSECALYWMPER